MITRRLAAPLALSLALIGPAVSLGQGGPAPQPATDRLRSHVTTLASPEFLGRRDEGAAKARDYVEAELRRLRLAPLFGDSYRQDVTGGDPPQVLGTNIGARIDGTDASLAHEWVLLGAHFDHLGVHGGVVYPGADDNASGVAMMLEVARSVAEGPTRPRRGIMLVGFDLEERGPNGEFGLRGSQFFARNPPRPIGEIRLMITADMIGRALGGVCREDLFVLGSEHEPGVRPWLRAASRDQPVRLDLLGSDVLVIDRSDYGPFRTRQVPYLFFTTGENPLYHSPRDLAATLDYTKLTAASRIITGVVREALAADRLPDWTDAADSAPDEARALRDVMVVLLDHREGLKIGPTQAALIRQAIRTAEAAIARGSTTPAERATLIRTAQVVLFTVF